MVRPRRAVMRPIVGDGWWNLAVLAGLLVACAGCHGGRPAVRARELAAIPGLSVVERDGLFLRIKRAGGAGSVRLEVAGREVGEAELRVGDRFSVVDAAGGQTVYRIMIAGDDRVVLKRVRTIDRLATGGRLRTTEDVVAVSPYNLEEPGPTRGPS